MSRCLTKIGHSCGTRDGLQVFEKDDGTIDGFCFSCNKYIEHPFGEGAKASEIPAEKRITKTREEIERELEEIGGYPCIDLPSRKLRGTSLDHYGIKVGVSEQDGKTPSIVYFPYTRNGVVVGYKVRLLEAKRMWAIGSIKDVDLFGWEQAKKTGAKRLIITEGEFDAVALNRIIDLHTKETYQDYKPAIVSLIAGATSAKKDLSRLMPEIKKFFKEVSVCFDNDDPGKKAVADVCKLFPEVTSITLPCKDANECIEAGASTMKAAYAATTFRATKPKNSRIVWGRDVHESAKKKAEWGLSYPWKALTDLTRGARYGETLYWGAGEKMGKSEILNALTKHFIVEHGLKVFVAKPEESNNKTYKLVNSKVTGKIFHDPKVEFDEDAYEEGGEYLKDNLAMLNLYQNIKWEALKEDIQESVNQGCKIIFIDPITNLTNGKSSSETNEILTGVAQELATMAMDLDVNINIFCHLNKPPKGSTPWDRGGKITTDFFAGSSAMARSCNYAIGLEGNKDPDLSEEERNIRDLVLLSDREYGESGRIKLYWDRKTGLFNEVGQ